MRQSYETMEERHGKELTKALVTWNTIYRQSKNSQERKAVKLLINAVYRGGVDDKWVLSPQEAVKEVQGIIGENYKKVIRPNTNAPLSPSNMQVII